MNHLLLELVTDSGRDVGFEPIDLYVDGVRLIDAVAKVEQSFATAEGKPDLAGGYASLPSSIVYAPSRHFLGAPESSLSHGDKTAILICECGCEGCWDFACRIAFEREVVVWSDFEQVHRDWDYSALGSFEFERTTYEAAFKAAR